MNHQRILLLLIFIELIYILFSFFYPIQNQVYFLTDLFSPPSIKISKSDTTSAYSPAVLEALHSLKKSTIVSAILTNSYTGTITNIEKSNKNVSYPVTITLLGPNQIKNTFLLTQKNLATVKISDQRNNIKLPISIDQLQVGDGILIQETLNLQKDWPNTRETFLIHVTH